MKNFKYKYLKINAVAGLADKKEGDIVRIKCLTVKEKIKEGDKEVEKDRFIPEERYWRDRVKDAAIDKCVEFVDKPKPAKVEKQEGGKPGGKDAKYKSSKK